MSGISVNTFLRFLFVGASATLLHYAIMAGLMLAVSVTAGMASATGYILSTFYNYWANLHFTFGGGHKHSSSLPRFLVTASIGLGINQLILVIGLSLSLPTPVAQLFATAIVLIWNYLISAIWTFSKKHVNI